LKRHRHCIPSGQLSLTHSLTHLNFTSPIFEIKSDKRYLLPNSEPNFSIEFNKTHEARPPIFKVDFDRVMLELKQQRDEASEQRKEMKRVLEELIASRTEVDQLQMASKQTPERVQVDVHYQHVLKEMMSTKEEAKRERDSTKEEGKRFEERLDKLQELHREDAREQLRQTKEESRQREEAMLSREEARRKEAKEEARALREEAKEEARALREEAKEEARALREEVVELMEKAQKKEIENLSEIFSVKRREVRSPKGHTERKYERKYAPHNDSEHKNELLHNNNDHELQLDDNDNDNDNDNDDVEQNNNIEYLENDSDSDEREINSNEERHSEQQLGQGDEEREIFLLPSTSIITRPTPAPSAGEIDAWNPTEVVQEVIDKWISLAEEVYGKRSNSSVQNLHHIRSVMAENEMAFMPLLNICPNLPVVIAHMMVIHVGISVRTVSWTSKMTDWTEEVSRSCMSPTLLFPQLTRARCAGMSASWAVRGVLLANVSNWGSRYGGMEAPLHAVEGTDGARGS